MPMGKLVSVGQWQFGVRRRAARQTIQVLLSFLPILSPDQRAMTTRALKSRSACRFRHHLKIEERSEGVAFDVDCHLPWAKKETPAR
jgi:hypothetical protein